MEVSDGWQCGEEFPAKASVLCDVRGAGIF